MNKTIREVAEQIGVSKTAIRQHINNIPEFKDKYVKITGNRFIISNEGVRILKRNFAKLSQTTSQSSQSKNAKTLRSETNKTHTNKDKDKLIALLSKQIEIKDQQLAERTQEIKELHTLLDNSQKLQLIRDKEVKRLREKVQLLEDSETQTTSQSDSRSSQDEVSDNEKPVHEETEDHKKWWQFWK